MNIERKAITLYQCTTCGDYYEMVGSVPIRLSQRPNRAPANQPGETRICPKHDARQRSRDLTQIP